MPPRRTYRRLLVAGLLALLVFGTNLLGATPATAVQAPYGTCAAVQIIGVRGTTEPQPGGFVLPDLANLIISKSKRTVLAYGVPYPASTDYLNSVNTGMSELADRMAISARYCPSQKFVLVGFSQGSWVIGDALGGRRGSAAPAAYSYLAGQWPAASATVSSALGAKVVAVVLYGDPRFRTGESYDTGGYKTGVSGLLPREKNGLKAYSSRIRSFCFSDDGICQYKATGSGHGRYLDDTTSAANFVVSKTG